MRDQPRSRIYQHFFNELTWDPHDMPPTETPEPYDDHKACLRDTLSDHLWRLIDCHSTPIQRQAARLLAMGFKQTECATMTGHLRQSTVQKAIFGNRDYQKGRRGALYGGLKRKMQTLIRFDYVIQKIIAEFREEDMPVITLEKLESQIEKLVKEVTSLNKRLNELEKEKKAGPYTALKGKNE